MNAPVHTRTFKSGNSVAVRLPKVLGVKADTEMAVERRGDEFVLRPVMEITAERARWRKMLDELKALPKPDNIEMREPIEFPDRPGL